ncbi:MAG TPA: efflux RND transporter permease subunit [Rhodobacterales bacterium]|nr:efflux RND transporter permease subunit [Rhodobacterales bacterium]
MTGLVDWAASRARMVLAFIALTLIAGVAAYIGLPKEGEPDIEIPALFVSVPFPGISAEDSERLLVKPMETELADIDGLKTMSGTAAENYAGVALEFNFGWDRTKVIADVRDAMNTVEAQFPSGADKYSVNEINFSEFPFIIVNLTGDVPERSLVHLAQQLQDEVEGIDSVLEVQLTGYRDEMLEVIIDPLALEAYNVTAGELINVVTQNNKLIAAGEVSTPTGANAIKIPSSFDDVSDIYALPVKVNGDSVVTLGDLADIRLTFEDRAGTARFNGETTVSLQVVKRKGFNVIEAAGQVRAVVESARADWPQALQDAVEVRLSNDTSHQVNSMVTQLENSVITAIALVMIVVLAALGMRSALLVGFAIPSSFLLTFALFAGLGFPVNNIVMFGLILSVGMLVDGAIVVVEYADKRISEGVGPMHAYVEAAKRMFWPIVSSTATTLSAFLPMLFWPGVPGEFMSMLPTTLIFVLTASLVVALVFLPIVGGVAGRMSRFLDHTADFLRPLPWLLRAGLVIASALGLFVAAMQVLNPDYIFPSGNPMPGWAAMAFGLGLFWLMATLTVVLLDAIKPHRAPKRIKAGYRRTLFGHFTAFISGNPIMPVVTIVVVLALVAVAFVTYGRDNNGVEFFAQVEPEQAIVYVRARGNLSVEEKDAAVARVEQIVLSIPGVKNTFAFAGAGGLNQNTGGAQGPRDQVGQVQIEMSTWEDRPVTEEPARLFGIIPYQKSVVDETFSGNTVVAALKERLVDLPGIETEVLEVAGGPASAKPVQLRLKGDEWDSLTAAAQLAHDKFDSLPGLTEVEDTRPLPGIDWQLDVDVEKAGRYGTNVATVGGMVQLVTNGLLLDTMRVPSSDEEIEIRVRLPQKDRVLSSLDTLKLRTQEGLVPLSNFVTRKPVPTLAQIDRVDQSRYFDVKAAVADDLVVLRATDAPDSAGEVMTQAAADARIAEADPGAFSTVVVTPSERIEAITAWLETDPLPDGVTWEWAGDQMEQAESSAFLAQAFSGALFLMFLILLAQFNSFYNSVLVLLAVVLSTAGVLVGMLVMGQPFSIIMTGTGIVALAGIVVNNNIVLIDTYQEYSRFMPRTEAIARTAEDRIRPVLLTTITTMAGLAPMMYGLSFDFIGGGYSVDAPTALWWKQLATAVVFGLGIATVLTLVFTPAMLALRVWITAGAFKSVKLLTALSMGRESRAARDLALARTARATPVGELVWEFEEAGEADEGEEAPLFGDVEAVLRDHVAHSEAADEGDEAGGDEAAGGEAKPTGEGTDADGNPLRAAE